MRSFGTLAAVGLVFVSLHGVARADTDRGSVQVSRIPDFSAKAVSSSRIVLSWGAPTRPVSRYIVLRNGIKIATLKGRATNFNDDQLAPSTTYKETVTAVDSTNQAPFAFGTATTTTFAVPGRHPGLKVCPQGSVVLEPGEDIQAAINSQPAGSVFYFTPGIYRLTTALKPKSYDTFEGAPGAIINGSALLTFTPEGSYYGATNVPQQDRGNKHGSCDAAHPLCRYVQDLYFDGKPLMPVDSMANLGSGRFFFDRAASTVYLYDNPFGHVVELGRAYAAFDSPTAEAVWIANLTIEKFATEGQFGAVGFRVVGSGWIVENNDVRLNHAAGITIGRNGVVRGNYVHDNGEKGITGGDTSNILIVNNEMSSNNYAGYDCGWECGGMKFGATSVLKVIGNYVHDNLGIRSGNGGAPGLWCDVDCTDVTFENNVVRNNGGSGIYYEISHQATIRYNVLDDNGHECSWGFGAGIAINESDHVEAYGNVLSNNHNGVVGVQQNRGAGPRGRYELAELHVHDNLISVISSQSYTFETMAGIFVDNGDTSVFTYNNNTFVNDTYRGIASVAQPRFGSEAPAFHWLNGPTTATRWRSFGNDKDGRFFD